MIKKIARDIVSEQLPIDPLTGLLSTGAGLAPHLNLSFEAAMAELGELVDQMEAGALPLEASVAAYRRGAELVRLCTTQLDRVDQQVKILEGDILKPFAASGENTE
jgi:exodeoxyribonuclease VII small subunit